MNKLCFKVDVLFFVLVVLGLVPIRAIQQVSYFKQHYLDPAVGSTGCTMSNEGHIFHLAFMSNIADQPKHVPVEVFVSTFADHAHVTLDVAAHREEKHLSRGKIICFQIPRELAVLADSGQSSRGHVVRVMADHKIVVYGANKEQYSTDAFLALPENAIGTEYYAVTWYPPTNFAKPDYCQLAVASTSKAASVQITLPRQMNSGHSGGRWYQPSTAFLGPSQGLPVTYITDLVPPQFQRHYNKISVKTSKTDDDGDGGEEGENQVNIRAKSREDDLPFRETRHYPGIEFYAPPPAAYPPPRPYPGYGDFDGFYIPPVPLLGQQPHNQQQPGPFYYLETGPQCSVQHQGRTYYSGETLTVQLRELESVQLESKCDLTGAHIVSTSPVAVFSGNARTAIGPGAITRDHLVEQLPPVASWGHTFITFPTPRRTVGDYLKIIASEDRTQIEIVGQKVQHQSQTLNAGQQWQLDLGCKTYALIRASKPILVVSFVRSQTVGTEPADPAMSLVMPIEQFGRGYTFNTVEGVATAYENFMTIVVHRSHENTLLLDGVPVVPAEGWTAVPGSEALVGYVTLRPGCHTIVSQSGHARFAAYIYGAGDRESYFYPTGMCLKQLTCPSTPGCCCHRCDMPFN